MSKKHSLNSSKSKIYLLYVLNNYSYNGFLPQGDRGRRRSKFILYKRSQYNGVKRSKHYIVQSPETTHAILDTNQHSISYTLSRNQAVIVEYQEDENTDMFQVKFAASLCIFIPLFGDNFIFMRLLTLTLFIFVTDIKIFFMIRLVQSLMYRHLCAHGWSRIIFYLSCLEHI